MWHWYDRLASGRPPLVPREAWLRLCEREGWDEPLAFDLLGVIESAWPLESE